MTRSLLAFSIILWSLSALSAQAAKTYGFKAGMNLAQHYGTKIDETDMSVKTGLRPGIIGGAYMDLNVLPSFAIGFELLYSMKGSSETITIKRMDTDDDGISEELIRPAVMKIKYHLDYVELPILMKINVLDSDKISLDAVAGTAMSLKVRSSHALDGIVYFPDGNGGYSEIPIIESSKLPYVNMFDYSFVYGGTLRFKRANPFFLEYRFTLGWDYLKLPTYQLSEPAELRNQTYSLMLGYEL
ncbi:MAG: outer membrane beta-barrel protein [Candidatus Cloacimonadaceae bacterium]|nr:outer membrane beta-barrel protein [Candidatus Cloacimonadaceae bacterium]